MAGLVGLAGAIGVAATELYAPSSVPSFLTGTSSAVMGLPRSLGLAFLVNGVASTFLMTTLAFGTASWRKKLIAKAKKNGDKNADERFAYPKVVAEGFTPEAHQFNCVVRGHQHALEIYPIFLSLSALGALTLPLTVAYAGLLWIVARYCWAKGYATGEPKARYKWGFGFGFNVWTSILTLLVAASYTGISVLFF